MLTLAEEKDIKDMKDVSYPGKCEFLHISLALMLSKLVTLCLVHFLNKQDPAPGQYPKTLHNVMSRDSTLICRCEKASQSDFPIFGLIKVKVKGVASKMKLKNDKGMPEYVMGLVLGDGSGQSEMSVQSGILETHIGEFCCLSNFLGGR